VRRIADSGFSTLLMPDVQQWQPAPGPTLAVAATLADLRVGTWVYASPLRAPWSMAWEAHLLLAADIQPFDELAGGAILGHQEVLNCQGRQQAGHGTGKQFRQLAAAAGDRGPGDPARVVSEAAHECIDVTVIERADVLTNRRGDICFGHGCSLAPSHPAYGVRLRRLHQ